MGEMRRSILLQYDIQYAPIEPMIGQLGAHFELALTETWHLNTELCVYVGHRQDEQAMHLNRDAVQRQAPLIIFTPLETAFEGVLVIPHESPCLACWEAQQPIFRAISVPKASVMLTQSHTQAIFRVLHAYMTQANDHIRAGILTQFAYADEQVMRQFRIVKSPRCSVCSSLLTHSAESYRSYLV